MNTVIKYFSLALLFISAITFLTNSVAVDQELNEVFRSVIEVAFLPSIFAFVALVAILKVKQFKDGVTL